MIGMGRPSHAGGGDERFLLPGQWFFGSGGRIRTLLGSCVAVTMWHPLLRMGGVCHFVLPRSNRPRTSVLDGRYGDQAIEAMVQAAQRATPRLLEYRVGLFGGGRMFSHAGHDETSDIGQRNIELAHDLLDARGLLIRQMDVGGTGHRTLALDLDSGAVAFRHVDLTLVKEKR